MSETGYNAPLAEDRHERIMHKLDEIVRQTTETNGRTRLLETKVAVLEERNPGKQGGAWGAVAGVLGGFLAGLVKP